MLQPVYIVAFTGHRSSNAPGRSPSDLEACRPLIANALQQLQQQVASNNGIIHLISSAAEGADTIALETAQSMGITTHILLPLPEGIFKEDFADREQAWPATEALVRHAESGDNIHSVKVSDSTHERPDCYADTNDQMLASADALIALWNQEPAQGTGGTAEVWNSAEAKDIARIHIHPVTKSVTPHQLEALNSPHDPSHQIFDQLSPYLPEPDSHKIDPENPHCIQCHTALDEAANEHSKSARDGLKTSIILHGSASLLAALGVSYALAGFPHKYSVLICVAVIEFFLIWKAERIHKNQHKTHTGEKWIQFRFAAELLRPYHLIRQHLDPFRPLIQHHHPEWRRFLLSIGLAQPIPPVKDLENAKADYISGRIDDQTGHFRKKLAEASPSARRIYKWMRFSAQSALIVVLISIPIKATHFEAVHDYLHGKFPETLANIFHTTSPYVDLLLYFFPIALPLLAGILLAYRQSLDIGRRNLRYQHMIGYLEKMKTNITHAHTPHSFQTLVAKTEDTLLDELKEFDIAQRIGLEH